LIPTGLDGNFADCAHAAPLGNKIPIPVARPAPAMNVRREIPVPMFSSTFKQSGTLRFLLRSGPVFYFSDKSVSLPSGNNLFE
jgi:hypothetical protein